MKASRKERKEAARKRKLYQKQEWLDEMTFFIEKKGLSVDAALLLVCKRANLSANRNIQEADLIRVAWLEFTKALDDSIKQVEGVQ
jgi:hypothetical protein